MEKIAEYIKAGTKVLDVPVSPEGVPAEPVRLLFGRGGRAPGFEDINIDFFPPLIYAALYRMYSEDEIIQLEKVLNGMFPGCPVLVQDRSVRPAEFRNCTEEIPQELTVTEGGLNFLIHPLRGQNPGFFSDMRSARRYIRELIVQDVSSGSGEFNVLNLFSYTCALSVAALAAGAAKVVNIDKNSRSLEIGKRNHSMNSEVFPDGKGSKAVFLPHDIFKSFGKLGKEGPYSLIIADPPPTQMGSFMTMKDYPRLLKRLPGMLAPGGRILLSHNSPGWGWDDFEAMVSENLEGCQILSRLEPPPDFAPAEAGRGLKILVCG